MPNERHELYHGQVILEYSDAAHRYYITDGNKKRVQCPSVTTIVSVIDKPFLVQWAANKAVELIKGAIGPGVEYEEIYLEAVFDAAKSAHRKIKEEAGAIGTQVHAILQGDGGDVGMNREHIDTRVVQGVAAGLSFLSSKHKVELIHNELPIYSRRHRYSGRLDRIAIVDGRLSLVDWKTSNGIWPEYFIQISAYRSAYEEELGEKIEKCYLVHLDKTTGEFHDIPVGRTKSHKDFQTFLSCLKIYNDLKELKKRLKKK